MEVFFFWCFVGNVVGFDGDASCVMCDDRVMYFIEFVFFHGRCIFEVPSTDKFEHSGSRWLD